MIKKKFFKENIIDNVNHFNSNEADYFEPDTDNLVLFDGTMHLKSQEEFDLVDNGVLGEGHTYSLDLTPIKESVTSGRYKEVISIEVS